MTRLNLIKSITLLLFLLLFITGCGNVSRMITISAQLCRECKQLVDMELTEIETLISPDINIDRLKYDPEGILGQYVRLKGHIDTKGTKDFPLDVSAGKLQQETSVFILEDAAFIITLKEYPEIQHNDMVEIIGLVSKSRFLKATAELYPDENYPDLVTVIAKDIKIVKPEEPVEEETPKEESPEDKKPDSPEDQKPDAPDDEE